MLGQWVGMGTKRQLGEQPFLGDDQLASEEIDDADLELVNLMVDDEPDLQDEAQRGEVRRLVCRPFRHFLPPARCVRVQHAASWAAKWV